MDRACVLVLVVVGSCMISMAGIRPGHAQAVTDPDRVFLTVPIVIHAPGMEEFIKAYHDGERFYVDVEDLLSLLGFTVTSGEQTLSAFDTRHSITLDYDQLTATLDDEQVIPLLGELQHSEGMYLITILGLKRVFDADLSFDEARLSLQLSSVATRFDSSIRERTRFLGSEVPGPLLFNLNRHLLSGGTLSWHATSQRFRSQQVYSNASVRYTLNMLGGVVKGSFGTQRYDRDLLYTFVRPRSKMLSRVDIGRIIVGQYSVGTYLQTNGVRLTNRPLVTPRIQRTSVFRGRVEPHAVVEARTGGRVADRVQADAAGRYGLRVPTYYGTSEVVLYVSPLGEQMPYERHLYVLTTRELALPGHLYYDASIGKESAGELQYGITPRLTGRLQGDTQGQYRAGFTASPLHSMVLSADVTWPLQLPTATMQLWRRGISAQALFTSDYDNSRWTSANLSWRWQRWAGYVSASGHQLSGVWVTRRLSPAISYHGRRGLSVRNQLHVTDFRGIRRTAWRTTGGYTFRMWNGGSRIDAVIERAAPGFTYGFEFMTSFKRIHAGVSMTYDSETRTAAGQLTLQLRSSVGSVYTRATSGGTHTYSGYGTISFNPRPSFSHAPFNESGVLLRVFEDLNRNGLKDPEDSILPYVQVQLWHSGLSRQKDGALRASHLEPYAAYQVRILERSIRDPWLRPATGYTFSFVAEPGRIKKIDIPLQRLPLIRGRIVTQTRAPSRLQVAVLKDQTVVDTVPVYRDGGFAIRLPAGRYTLRVVDVVDETTLVERSVDVPFDGQRLDVKISLD